MTRVWIKGIFMREVNSNGLGLENPNLHILLFVSALEDERVGV